MCALDHLRSSVVRIRRLVHRGRPTIPVPSHKKLQQRCRGLHIGLWQRCSLCLDILCGLSRLVRIGDRCAGVKPDDTISRTHPLGSVETSARTRRGSSNQPVQQRLNSTIIGRKFLCDLLSHRRSKPKSCLDWSRTNHPILSVRRLHEMNEVRRRFRFAMGRLQIGDSAIRSDYNDGAT
jgi:hypothetical protein